MIDFNLNWIDGPKRGMHKHNRILITGAHGFLGNALVKTLQDRGYKNLFCPRYTTAAETIIRAKPDYVFHLAGRVRGIGGNINSQYEGFYENAKINLEVVHACQISGVKKVVAMGTGAVYPVSDKPLEETEVWRGPPHASEYGYAQAKRMCLAQLECSELKYAYVISGNLYGPGDHFNTETAHVIPSLITKFHKYDEPVVWGDGSPTRDFLHVDMAAACLCLIMDNIEGSVNMASGIHSSIKDVVTILEHHTGKKARYDTSKPMGQQTRIYDTSKLYHLDFGPGISLEQGVRETYDWYKQEVLTAA